MIVIIIWRSLQIILTSTLQFYNNQKNFIKICAVITKKVWQQVFKSPSFHEINFIQRENSILSIDIFFTQVLLNVYMTVKRSVLGYPCLKVKNYSYKLEKNDHIVWQWSGPFSSGKILFTIQTFYFISNPGSDPEKMIYDRDDFQIWYN